MAYWIITDACCDLPTEYISKQEDFLVVPMSYQIDGKVYELNPTKAGLDRLTHEFYDMLRDDKIATTFQVNQQAWMDVLTPHCEKGEKLLVIAFSSGLSGTYNAAKLAGQELERQYPDCAVRVIDSLSASAGQGLLVDYALQNRAKGMSFEENATWTNDNVENLIHWFTVDDLHCLKRGGRVSAASAYFGTMLKIKPVLHVDYQGHLIPMEKVQGRKHSLRSLFDKAKEFAVNPDQQTMFISHGDCLEEAQWLKEKLQTELNVPNVQLSMIGPVIGSHSGPGTVALFFMGKGR